VLRLPDFDPSARVPSDERSAISRARQRDPAAVETRFQRALPTERASVVEMVVRHLSDPDPRLREACAWMLHVMRPEDGSLSAPAVTALVLLARDEDDDVRDWALFGLGRGGGVQTDTAAVREAFAENATHPNPRVQREAIEGLAQLGDHDALARALEHFDVDPETVEAAVRAGDPRLAPALRSLRDRGWAQLSDGTPSPVLAELLAEALAASAA
jgi:HEAT repeat protein